jgi:hypothetical protein
MKSAITYFILKASASEYQPRTGLYKKANVWRQHTVNFLIMIAKEVSNKTITQHE